MTFEKNVQIKNQSANNTMEANLENSCSKRLRQVKKC
jgi:hypothetical protein